MIYLFNFISVIFSTITMMNNKYTSFTPNSMDWINGNQVYMQIEYYLYVICVTLTLLFIVKSILLFYDTLKRFSYFKKYFNSFNGLLLLFVIQSIEVGLTVSVTYHIYIAAGIFFGTRLF